MTGSVVLVHGLRTSSSMWRHQREVLEALGHTVVTPDLPGHGSRMDERFTLAGGVATIEKAVTDAPGPVFLVGFSLGGYLAAHWAAERPRDITGLLAASCGTQPTRAILDAWRFGAGAIHLLPDRGLGLNNALVRAVIRDPAYANDVIAGGVALEVMQDALRELRGIRMEAALSRIDLPVWLVNGTLDHIRLQERRFLAATRRGTLVRIPGATHMVSLARPAEFTSLLTDAINASRPAAPA
ncbi:alpha/beta hydrolase [Conyzicola nivalis]|uniref:Lysophospholipase n=1 Tax=Conyzicola nivalis TaxID=1477021 RepID=A0A916SFF4_9MICO|nr:alpha/beta fold hydrolase [Conyzicola nivalis]GGA98231.1 lysophospholipase [Conyzicola nivalis]